MKSKRASVLRSGEIDVWKFIFAIVIVILHSSYLPIGEEQKTFLHGGSIGVEYFFIVSGFFMAASAAKKESYHDLCVETKAFLKKKISAFYPYMVTAFLIALFVKTLYFQHSVEGFVKNSVNGIVELMLIRASGLGKSFFNTPTWYLSAMLCSMVVLYPLLRKYRKFFSQIICPLLSLFILGYLYQKYGQFRTPDAWDGVFLKGTIRGFAELAFGVSCYEMCQWMKQFQFTALSKWIFTIAEYGGLAAIIWYSNTAGCWDMDCPSILIMGFAVIIMGGNFSILSDFWNSLPVTAWLGRFSMMLYLNHIYWVWIFALANVQLDYPTMVIWYMVCSICSALICWMITNGVIELFRKNRDKVITLFIQSKKEGTSSHGGGC